jgi:hypothetical protein
LARQESELMNTTPSHDEWQRLFAAGAAFKAAQPWEWMAEQDVFGVRNPESGEIGYVGVMGGLGEHFCMALYLGEEALARFWQLQMGEVSDAAFILEIPQLQASWEDRDYLTQKDRDVIKAMGLRFRGRGAWPLFRSFVPGHLPWYVSAQEARFLTFALEQALVVAPRVRENPNLLAPLLDLVYLVRTPEEKGGSLVWRDQWLELESLAYAVPVVPVADSDVADLRQLPMQDISVEVDLFPLTSAIQDEKESRPYFPYSLMLAESSSGFVLGADLLMPQPTLQTVWKETPFHFLKAIERWGYRPAQVRIRSERLVYLLQSPVSELGIDLQIDQSLPAVDEARMFLEETFP